MKFWKVKVIAKSNSAYFRLEGVNEHDNNSPFSWHHSWKFNAGGYDFSEVEFECDTAKRNFQSWLEASWGK